MNPPSSKTYHADPNRPGSARGPLFEFNNSNKNIPNQITNSTMNTKKMIKEKNRKHRKMANKSRQKMDHKIYSNMIEHKGSDEILEGESMHSENTAINISQNEIPNIMYKANKSELAETRNLCLKERKHSMQQLHSPDFGYPENNQNVVAINKNDDFANHPQTMSNKYHNHIKSDPKLLSNGNNYVTYKDYDRLIKQNNDLKQMVTTLSDSMTMLTHEYSKNMESMKNMYTNLYSKHTLLENKVKYMERRIEESNPK